jgi:tetratricopeptide (TPR) repeat protein
MSDFPDGTLRKIDLGRLAPVLIVGALLVAYVNSLAAPFILDDLRSIVRNVHIRHLWPLGNTIQDTSRPVVHLSLALNYALDGYNVAGYHAFNLAVHMLAALTLFGIARRTLDAHYGASARWLAVIIALVWALHPLQTQSVTYVIQRAESLMGLFYLLTLYCFIRGTHSEPWYVAALVCCALGMACKPIMVTAPLIVLLYDRTFVAKSVMEALRQRCWFYLGLAATWVLLAWLLAIGPREWQGSAGPGQVSFSTWEYLRTQPGVILHYLRLMLYPSPLCLDYAWPMARTASEIAHQALVITAMLAATAWAWMHKPWLGFLGAWFFLILAPSSSAIPLADLAFEHRVYLSLAAVAALFVIGGYELCRRVALPVKLGVAALVVLGLGCVTIHRNLDYRSELSIWSDTVAKRPNNWRAQSDLGVALERDGRTTEAMVHYEEAIRLKPDYAIAHSNLGVALAKQGQIEEAVAQFDEALRLEPASANALYNLGLAFAKRGQSVRATSCYRRALLVDPYFALAWNALAKR